MTVQSLTHQQRAAILAREAEARAQLKSGYDALWERLFLRLHRLLAQIQHAQASGQEVKISWLYEAGRLQSLLDQVQQELSHFASDAMQDVQRRASLALLLGEKDALALLEAQRLRPGVFSAFHRLPKEALDALYKRFHPGSHLAKVFANFAPDAVRRVKGTLLYGVSAGIGPRELAYQIMQDLGVEYNRALRIARTELMDAWRDGSLAIYRAHRDVVSGWTWLTSIGACPACQDMAGTHHSLDEDMDSHPNCRCTMQPDTVSYDTILAELA